MDKVGAGSTMILSLVVEDAGDKLETELIEDDLLGGGGGKLSSKKCLVFCSNVSLSCLNGCSTNMSSGRLG